LPIKVLFLFEFWVAPNEKYHGTLCKTNMNETIFRQLILRNNGEVISGNLHLDLLFFEENENSLPSSAGC